MKVATINSMFLDIAQCSPVIFNINFERIYCFFLLSGSQHVPPECLLVFIRLHGMLLEETGTSEYYKFAFLFVVEKLSLIVRKKEHTPRMSEKDRVPKGYFFRYKEENHSEEFHNPLDMLGGAPSDHSMARPRVANEGTVSSNVR
jgi:hypothetical protein